MKHKDHKRGDWPCCDPTCWPTVVNINTPGDYASAQQCPNCGHNLEYYEQVRENLGLIKRKK